MHYPARR